MKRSKILALAAIVGLAIAGPVKALDNNVRLALDELKRSYNRINTEFIRTYQSYRSQGSNMVVRIDQSGFDKEAFSGNCPVIATKRYKATEALGLLPAELISMINARVVQSYNEGYRDYRDGYLEARTTNYTWMTNEWIWDGIHLITPFDGAATYRPAEVDTRLKEAAQQIERALSDTRAFIADDSNFFMKKTGVWPFRSEKPYLTNTATGRYKELKSQYTRAMTLYATIADGLIDAAKADARKKMQVNFANVATVMMLGNRLSLKLYLVQQFGSELYYTAEALVSAAYRGGYRDARNGLGYRSFSGYDTSYSGSWGWSDGYDTTGGRIYDRGDRIAGEDYYGGSSSNGYDTDPSYDGYNTYDSYDTHGGGYDTNGGSYDTYDSYDTNGGGDAPVYDGGSDYDSYDSYDSYDTYGGSGSLPGEDF